MNFKLNYLLFSILNFTFAVKREIMSKVTELKTHLKRGMVYRRSDLGKWSNAVDRHLILLVQEGTLQRLYTGLYYYPEKSVFGNVPPDEEKLVRTFLKDDYFLLTSPNHYNALGVGTTQLYNKQVVYNHKRHGEFKLGSKTYSFQLKHRFPKKATTEFLLVDLLNNLNNTAEDTEVVMKNVIDKLKSFNLKKLKRSVKEYGNVRTQSLLIPYLESKA
jgi:hypothetical protein